MKKIAVASVLLALLLFAGYTALAQDENEKAAPGPDQAFKAKFPNALFLIPEERVVDWDYKVIGVVSLTESLEQQFPLRQAMIELREFGKNVNADVVVEVKTVSIPGFLIVYGTAVVFKEKDLKYPMWVQMPDGKLKKKTTVPLRYRHARDYDEVAPLQKPILSTTLLNERYCDPSIIVVPRTPRRRPRNEKVTIEMDVRSLLDLLGKEARDNEYDAVVDIEIVSLPNGIFAYGTAVRFLTEDALLMAAVADDERAFVVSTIGLDMPYTVIKVVGVTANEREDLLKVLKSLSEEGYRCGADGLIDVELKLLSKRIFAVGTAISFRDIKRIFQKPSE